ncbi:MAG: pyridoxamine 5'-phosphate oxidase family protein [Deltaproteobacteria bacterium]|nr:pyridoxamine 5'-phosphate oxidase family protein [Deltaproteobacteria bacterium]
MKKLLSATTVLLAVISLVALCKAGDNNFIYVKPGDKPPMHVIVDENLKCVECHPIKTKDIDGYTSATMTLKKSQPGVMPKQDIEKRVVEVLSGKHGREVFMLATSYNNKPLATVIEFCIDPETLDLYAMSEQQGEKLFQMNENDQVSLAYVRPAENYFKELLGVQIVGRAKLLTAKDPGWAKGLEIYLPSLPIPEEAKQRIKNDKNFKKIMTKVTPDRIVLRDISLKAKDLRNCQIWEREILQENPDSIITQ